MTTSTTRQWTLLAAALLAIVTLVAFGTSLAQAQAVAPKVVSQNITTGDTLGEKPFVIQLCFDRQILVHDLPPTSDGEFEFRLMPRAQSADPTRNIAFGLRIVFQPDGWGLAVYPGNEPTAETIATLDPVDPWRFTWHVVDAETRGPNDGEIAFDVVDGADPVPAATPPACGGNTEESPATAVSQVGSATPRPTRTPVPSGFTEAPSRTAGPSGSADASPDASGSPTATGGATTDEDDDDGPDILLLALLTIGAAGGLGVLALIGYAIRRRVGFDPHKPGPGSGSGHH